MSTRVGLAFCEQPNDVPSVVEAVQQAERDGVESVWFAEDLWTRRDGFVYLTAAALATSEIRVGTAIATAYTRTAMQLAMTFNTLSDVAPDRLVLGLGAGLPWHPLFAAEMARVPPVPAVREHVAQFRRLASGGAVRYGDSDLTLSVDRMCFAALPQGLREVPVFIGATGPLMTDLAGRIGDGLIIGNGRSPAETRAAVARAAEARRLSETPDRHFEVVAIIVVSASDDGRPDPNVLCKVAGEVARLPDEAVRTLGFDSERCRRIRESMDLGDCVGAFDAIDRTMLDSFVAAGTEEDCVRVIRGHMEAGVDVPLLMPFGRDLEAVLRLAAALRAH